MAASRGAAVVAGNVSTTPEETSGDPQRQARPFVSVARSDLYAQLRV